MTWQQVALTLIAVLAAWLVFVSVFMVAAWRQHRKACREAEAWMRERQDSIRRDDRIFPHRFNIDTPGRSVTPLRSQATTPPPPKK